MSSIRKHLSRTSPLVTDHICALLQEFPSLAPGEHILKPTTHTNSNREEQLFWKYQSHFPLEFVNALHRKLHNNHNLIEYNHYTNTLIIEVK